VFVDCLTDYWDSVSGCVVRLSNVCVIWLSRDDGLMFGSGAYTDLGC
jgi:hypothetical protein